MCVGMWLLCWGGMSWRWAGGGVWAGYRPAAAALHRDPSISSHRSPPYICRGEIKKIYTRRGSIEARIRGQCWSHMSAVLWHIAGGQRGRESGWGQYPPLCGDNIHSCWGQYPPLFRGHVAGGQCGWREWHVRVWHNVPPVSPHHTVTALWATWQHHRTFGCWGAEQKWQKKSKSSAVAESDNLCMIKRHRYA